MIWSSKLLMILILGFCRESVFSLTSDYNNGAASCSCNGFGSLSFECNKFGGQCDCKPHVIGRRCESCENGYYGFPDCLPCNCPFTARCEEETGKITLVLCRSNSTFLYCSFASTLYVWRTREFFLYVSYVINVKNILIIFTAALLVWLHIW